MKKGGHYAPKRKNVVMELVETEKNYMESLRLCERLYEIPLSYCVIEEMRTSETSKELDPFFQGWIKGKKHILHKSDYEKLFCNLNIIREINEKLLEKLQAYVKDEKSSESLGEIFLKFAPVLKDYTKYTNSYQQAITHLNQMREENKKFDNFMLKVTEHPRAIHSNLDSYLIQPIQRIPRYSLLLNEIIKKTSQYHKDYNSLNEALKMINETADFINKKLGEFERQLKLKELDELVQKDAASHSKLSNPLVVLGIKSLLSSNRVLTHYVNHCKLKITLESQEIVLDASVSICNDLIIICRRNEISEEQVSYTYFDFIQLDVDPLPWCFMQTNNRYSIPEPPSFSIISNNGQYTLEFFSEDKMITALIENVKVLDNIIKNRKNRKSTSAPIIDRPSIPFLNPLTNKVGLTSILLSLVNWGLNNKKQRLFLDKEDLSFFANINILKEHYAAFLKEIKNKMPRDSTSICYANATFNPVKANELQENGIAYFRKGDMFLTYGLVENGQCYLVKKMGMNCDKDCKFMLQAEKEFRSYKDLNKAMIDQKIQNKDRSSTEMKETESFKKVRRLANQNFVLVNAVSLKTELENLIQQQHQQIGTISLGNIFNVYSENGQVGLVPSCYMVELSTEDQIKALKIMDERDVAEQKKQKHVIIKTLKKSDNILKEGWMKKEETFWGSQYERFWFTLLQNGTLCYYKDEQLRQLQGEIQIETQYNIQKLPAKNGVSSDTPFSFCIQMSTKKIVLFVDSEETRDQWISAIHQCLGKIKPTNSH
jgi:hypothetical protein